MSRRGSTTAGALLLVGLVLVPGLAGASTGPTAAGPAVPSHGQVTQVATPDNNTTVQHRNPDDVDSPGDIEMVQSWFAGHMGEVLVDCTDGIAVGNYDVCDEVEEDYPSWLSSYIDLADETATETDDEAGSAFRAASRVENFSQDVKRFHQTYDEYQQAKAAGNETRARRLARRLVRQSGELNQTAPELRRAYRQLSDQTAIDLQPETDQIRSIQNATVSTANNVRKAEFVTPNLSASITNTTIGFTDPLRVSGRLSYTASPLADRQIRVHLGDQVVTTRTNASGGFNLTHRPTVLHRNTSEMSVRFVPALDSQYRRVSVTRDIQVTQTQATIEIDVDRAAIAFADPISPRATVSVDDQPVSGVPLRITAQGNRIGGGQTSENGTFALTSSFPATVPAGTRTLRARFPFENRALIAAPGETTLEVKPTDTNLSISATQTGSSVHVTGSLRAHQGTPVAGQPVTVKIGEQALDATTGQDGRFSVNRSIGDHTAASGTERTTLNVTAVFDGAGTNLRSARDSVTLTDMIPRDASPSTLERLSSSISGLITTIRSDPVWGWASGLLALGLGVIGYLAYRERLVALGSSSSSGANGQVSATRASERKGATVPGDSDTRTAEKERLLENATSHLDSGSTDLAVETAYAATRAGLEGQMDESDTLTHWEFLEACRNEWVADDDLRALERLTEAYEGAAFAPQPVSTDQAEAAVTAAQQLLDGETSGE